MYQGLYMAGTSYLTGFTFCPIESQRAFQMRRKVHVEEAGMTAYLFKLYTEKTIYCTNVPNPKCPLHALYGSNATGRQTSQEIHYQPLHLSQWDFVL